MNIEIVWLFMASFLNESSFMANGNIKWFVIPIPAPVMLKSHLLIFPLSFPGKKQKSKVKYAIVHKWTPNVVRPQLSW